MKIIASIRNSWPKIKFVMTMQFVGVIFSSLCALPSGCATAYLTDRGRDGADIFTATAGTGGGLQLRAGPVHVGALVSTDYAGLRAGTLFCNRNGTNMIIGETSDFLVIPLYGFGQDALVFRQTVRPERHKGYRSYYKIPFLSLYGLDSRVGNNSAYALLPEVLPHYTQCEITGGVLGTLRLGFNPGELVDFVLGWLTIDIYRDDQERRTKSNQSNQASQSIGAGAPQTER